MHLQTVQSSDLPDNSSGICYHSESVDVAERTVALLAFEDAKTSPIGELMEVSQRQKTASELNAAILRSQEQVGGASALVFDYQMDQATV